MVGGGNLSPLDSFFWRSPRIVSDGWGKWAHHAPYPYRGITCQPPSRHWLISLSERYPERSRAYHAGMKDSDRRRVENEFMNDEVEIVFATIAYGLGVDKRNIRTVVHESLPQTIEDYWQQGGGRTWRS